MGFLLVDVNGLEPLTLRTSSVICTPLQLLKQRIYAGKEQYRVAKNKTVAHKLHTKNDPKILLRDFLYRLKVGKIGHLEVEMTVRM